MTQSVFTDDLRVRLVWMYQENASIISEQTACEQYRLVLFLGGVLPKLRSRTLRKLSVSHEQPTISSH